MKRPVCIYIDNSNIYIGGQWLARRRGEDSRLFRISFKNFLLLITNGTNRFDEIVWGGSIFKGSALAWQRIQRSGIEPLLIPRALNGENETVDQAIQLVMYRNARKYRHRPGTIILCTGDGSGFREGKGFLYDVSGFIDDGWELVLYSWDHICNRRLRQFAKRYGRYIDLNKYYYHITYIKGGRRIIPFRGWSEPAWHDRNFPRQIYNHGRKYLRQRPEEAWGNIAVSTH
jgi:hypothetical protein